MNNDLNDALERVSHEVEAALDAMYIALQAFNERMERVEKWISDQEKRS